MSLSVQGLNKFYGQQQVLKDVSFSINTGEIVGFLGPNGAGKSTTMKVITGYLTPNSGNVSVQNINVQKQPLEAQKIIGYLPEHNPLYLDMYVKEYLQFVAQIYKVGKKESHDRVAEIIEQTGLTEEYKKKIGHLSKGYRQRVGLAQALVHNPKVLILDEPTTGLDPNQIVEVRQLIKNVGKDKTVILSTHIMQEVNAICDRFIIIKEGRIVADDASNISVADNNFNIIAEFAGNVSEDELSQLQHIEHCFQIRTNTYCVESTKDIRSDIFRFAVEKGVPLLTLQLKEKDMEEIFREVTMNK